MLKIEFSFDDGSYEDIRVAELLDKYGFKNATFYIPCNWTSLGYNLGRYPMDLNQLETISKKYEIGAHTVTHPMLTRIPITSAERELRDGKYLMKTMIGREITKFAYPRGYANDEIRDLARKYYKSARNTLINGYGNDEDDLWQTPTTHIAGAKRKEYEKTTWLEHALETFKTAVQKAKNENIIYHAFGHGWEIEYFDAWKDFETLLREINASTPA